MLLALLKAGGISALAIGVVYLIYREIIRRGVIPRIKQWQGFALLCLLSLSVFVIVMTTILRANSKSAPGRDSVGESAEIVADRRALLRREIAIRKDKSAQYAYFVAGYEQNPGDYKLESSRLYGPMIPGRRDFVELDTRYLPSTKDLERLGKVAMLDDAAGKLVHSFTASYGRFVAAVDELARRRDLQLGAYKLQKFGQEASFNASLALCGLDADMGERSVGSGPEPMDCAPVHP